MSSASTHAAASSAPSTYRLLRWYWGLFRGSRWRIALGVALCLLQSLALVPIPLLFGRMLDKDLPAKDTRSVLLHGGTAAALYLLHALLSFSGRSVTLIATKRITELLRARLSLQLQQMSLGFHDREKASELHARVVMDTERIDIMGNAIVAFGMTSVIMFGASASLLAWVNFRLFLLSLLAIPFFIAAHVLIKPYLQRAHGNFRKGMETMSAEINDLLQSIRLVKVFARESHHQERAEDRFRFVTKSALRMTILDSFYGNTMGLLSNWTTVLVYVLGCYAVIGGGMTLGEVVAFVGMVGFLFQPLNTLAGISSSVFAGVASLIPVHSILHLNDPLELNEGKQALAKVAGEFRFEGVSFGYSPEKPPALAEIDLLVKPGETIALVGESGAGKSTLSSMVLGFYLPTKGRILVDGHDLRDVNLRTLRERVGVVSQDNVLFNTTIRENLRYGRFEATDVEVREAARQAQALEFIEAIPDGFDAVVGDRGVRLSGGQRQRIAIARALLKNPDVLIFDEATSALDSESEAAIQQALDRLRAGRTCFIIAHRLSTIRSADRILVLRDGRIVESGRHEQLLAAGGEYSRLSRRQFAA